MVSGTARCSSVPRPCGCVKVIDFFLVESAKHGVWLEPFSPTARLLSPVCGGLARFPRARVSVAWVQAVYRFNGTVAIDSLAVD